MGALCGKEDAGGVGLLPPCSQLLEWMSAGQLQHVLWLRFLEFIFHSSLIFSF